MARYSLHTAICDILGIEYPVILAGMGPTAGRGGGAAATAPLVAAVSNAGGLGVLGGAGSTPEELREEIRKVRSLTDKPFGVDLLLPSNLVRPVSPSPALPQRIGEGTTDWRAQIPQEYWDAINGLKAQFGIPEVQREGPAPGGGAWRIEDQVQVVLDERVPVFASGLGNPAPYVPPCRDLGIKVIALVGNVKNARRVADAGADIVVAQGHEAGGHTGRIGTLALVPQVVDAVAPVPVVAAGGIGDGRGLAAALALGAHGVWCGTAFLATEEANIAPLQKRKIVEASEEDTRVTRLYSGKTMRNITNPLIEAWDALNVKALPMGLQGLLIADLLAGIRAAGKEELLMNAAGQIAGLIGGLRPAKAVLDEIVDGAAEVLTRDLPARAQVAERAGAT
ncbi:MAG TPA: nitronate monooxygenase family protein [Dehalococcoidia bacterium]|nr:nitronate monooxygenase family protein [Dehalococcoidia bacterium]